MLDATNLAVALTVPCPRTACAAFLGEDCISYATRRVTTPHHERLIAAGVLRDDAPTTSPPAGDAA